ncbi:MAG: putative ABC transporter permease subunit [Planctomycetota bacterium]
MSDVAVLAWLKWKELRNRARLLARVSRFKMAVLAAFSVAFWASLYQIFLEGLRFLGRVALGYSFNSLIDAMFYVFFFALTVMLVFSNAIIGYSSYFRSREMGFLLARPLRPESLFLYKFFESLGFSSWAFLFLGTPLVAAYGRVLEAPWHFYAVSGVFLGAYMFVPAALGAIAALLVTVYAPRTRRGLVAVAVLAILAVAATAASRILAARAGPAVDLKLASEVFESTRFSRLPVLPSYWVGKGILELAAGRGREALFFLGLVAASGAFFTALAHSLSAGLLVRGWHASQGLRSARKYPVRGMVEGGGGARVFLAGRKGPRIVAKDIKSVVGIPSSGPNFSSSSGCSGSTF